MCLLLPRPLFSLVRDGAQPSQMLCVIGPACTQDSGDVSFHLFLTLKWMIKTAATWLIICQDHNYGGEIGDQGPQMSALAQCGSFIHYSAAFSYEFLPLLPVV